MSDPKYAQEARRVAQERLREMVSKVVTPVIQSHRGPLSAVEEAFVRAIYSRKLG